MLAAFEGIEIDTDRREIRRNGSLVSVQPQVFDLLAFLITERKRVVSRDDLLAKVWGGRTVSDSTLATRIHAARHAIGDSGAAQRLIRTIHRNGFRFVGEVIEADENDVTVERTFAAATLGEAERSEAVSEKDVGPAIGGPAGLSASQLGEKRVATDARSPIAVLPFENLSDDPAQDALARSLTEDLTTAMCRIPDVLAVAAYPLDECRRSQVPLRQVADELGVRYVITGTVQKTGDIFRIETQLIDAATGSYLWGRRFDRPAQDLFALQDEITRRVLVALESLISSGDVARIDGRGTTSLEAWLLRTEALAEVWKFTPEATLRARALFIAARDLDPGWAKPWCGIARSYWWEAKQGWAESREDAIRIGVACAERAIELDPSDHHGYMQLGNFAQMTGDDARAIALREKAVALAPGHFAALWGLGRVLLEAGHTNRALAVFRRTAKAVPRPPDSLWWTLAHAELVAGNIDAAVAMAERTLAAKPTFPNGLANAAMAFAAARHMADARVTVARILEISPTYSIAEWWASQSDFRDRATVDWLCDLLSQAGVPPQRSQ